MQVCEAHGSNSDFAQANAVRLPQKMLATDGSVRSAAAHLFESMLSLTAVFREVLQRRLCSISRGQEGRLRAIGAAKMRSVALARPAPSLQLTR